MGEQAKPRATKFYPKPSEAAFSVGLRTTTPADGSYDNKKGHNAAYCGVLPNDAKFWAQSDPPFGFTIDVDSQGLEPITLMSQHRGLVPFDSSTHTL